jgi:hypothetical protein
MFRISLCSCAAPLLDLFLAGGCSDISAPLTICLHGNKLSREAKMDLSRAAAAAALAACAHGAADAVTPAARANAMFIGL